MPGENIESLIRFSCLKQTFCLKSSPLAPCVFVNGGGWGGVVLIVGDEGCLLFNLALAGGSCRLIPLVPQDLSRENCEHVI